MMKAASLVLLSAVIFTGCGTAEKVAVSTFRVVDAPAHFIRSRIDDRNGSTTTTTTVTRSSSDVTTPGYVVTQPTPPPVSHRTTTPPTSGLRKPTTTSTPAPRKPSPTPAARAASTQFPTARPVPGKPGYVYSLDPTGGMIDVTGYKSGDKAKDPYTKKIFIVP